MVTVSRISILHMYVCEFCQIAKFCYHRVAGENNANQNFNFLVSDHLKSDEYECLLWNFLDS